MERLGKTGHWFLISRVCKMFRTRAQDGELKPCSPYFPGKIAAMGAPRGLDLVACLACVQ